jgi:hypothetical protein
MRKRGGSGTSGAKARLWNGINGGVQSPGLQFLAIFPHREEAETYGMAWLMRDKWI